MTRGAIHNPTDTDSAQLKIHPVFRGESASRVHYNADMGIGTILIERELIGDDQLAEAIAEWDP